MNPMHDALRQQIAKVKEQYAELFLLLMHSLEEAPRKPGGTGVDRLIEQRKPTVERVTRDLREMTAQARAAAPLSAELEAELDTLREELRGALEATRERLRRREGEVANELDGLKGRIQSMKQRRKGAKGYQRPKARRALLKSEA